MVSKHTPGPYSVGEDGHGIWAMVDGVERRIASVSARAGGGELGASLTEKQKARRIATATLMAASSEMFDALIEIAHGSPDLAKIDRIARKAIAKAKGER